MNSHLAYSRFPRIVIVGAGLGGLCLAQNLRRRGIVADVYERDAGPAERPQGYRLHLDADGINALHESLSPELFQLFDATSMKAAPFTTIADTALAVRTRRTHDAHGGTCERAHDGLPSHVNVNRATLREVLLAGLDGHVHFAKKLSSFEERSNGVLVLFADGSQVEADVVVGADGIRSPVRMQRAPHAEPRDSAVRAIYGRIPLSAAIACIPRQARKDVFTVALDERKCFFGLGPVVFPTRPEKAAAALVPSARLSAQDDYVACIVGGRRELFLHDDATLRSLSPDALQALSQTVLEAWPRTTREILAHAEVSSFFFVEMYTSVPTELPPPTRVTLLGDAIHAMTPTLGRGANVALRDAALLAEQLAQFAAGRVDVAGALATYEAPMLSYGFDVVREAAAMGLRLIGQDPLPPPAPRDDLD